MLNLFISMLTLYEIYGDNLKFTQNDIDIFFNKYIKNLLNNQINVNELGYIILYLNNYITKEQIYKYFNQDTPYQKYNKLTIELDNDIIYIITDNFYNLFDINYSQESDILDNDIIDIKTNTNHNISIKDNWFRYDNNTLQTIINYIIKKNLKIYNITPNHDNLKIINNDIYFKDIKLLNILTDNELSKNFKYLISHLQNILIYSIHKQELKVAKDMIIKSFNKNVGHFYYININNNKKIKIKLNISLKELKNKLLNAYGHFNYNKSYNKSIYSLLVYFNIIKIDKPDYKNIKINIDNNMLNQEIQKYFSNL